MEYRSPLDNVFNFISGLPQGHDKAVKQALYNALALFALVLCCAAFYALQIILTPFIKPLIWALLVGSVLHPFKSSLVKRFRCWFDKMDESGTPVLIGIFLVPVNIFNDLSECIGSKLMDYLKYIVTLVIGIAFLHIAYYYTPRVCVCMTWKLASYTNSLIAFIIDNSTSTIISLVLLGYISLLYMTWSPQNNKKFHLAAIGVWLLLSCFLAHQFGSSFQTPIFIALQIIFVTGFVYEVYVIYEEMISSGHEVSFTECLTIAFQNEKITNDEGNKIIQAVSNLPTGDSKNNQGTIEEKSEIDGSKENLTKDASPQGDTANAPVSVKKIEKSKDPWSLELFEEKTSEQSKPKTDEAKTKLQPARQTSQPSSSLSDINRKHNFFKFTRSNSQPAVSGFRSRSAFNLFNAVAITPIHRKNDTDKSEPVQYASDFYLYSLVWLCGVTLLWSNLVMFPILIIPIVVYFIKRAGASLGLWNWIYRHCYMLLDTINNWCYERYDAFIPLPVRGLYKGIHKINVTLNAIVKDSIDTVASCVVILALLVFVICASVFVAIQIYTEAIMLVQMTSNVINQTVVNNPELSQLLPPSFDDTVDSILNNAYQYGREGITTLVRGIMSDVDSVKSAKLEKQVLELFDRLYQTWMSSDSQQGPKVTSDAIQSSWQGFIDDIQKSPEMFNINGITEFVKQNIGTFISLLDSVWAILKGNINIVMSTSSAFLSILLGGGTAVLNFILNVIVFLTTLFYLLNSSGDLYKPVELMTNFSPSGSRCGLALEGAISGVFTATFKLAAFYGLWTWLIHNWFSVKIVYLPSALATILGAVPFLGTYWACIPAVLDLWLAQGKGFKALLFAGFQFLPTSIVDTTIYNEIQGGGHPYLTGLAIAGGIFCLGVEGAILGPLLLCALYVIIDLSSTLFKDAPNEVPINIANLSRLEIQRL